jgi:hypothetical protein
LSTVGAFGAAGAAGASAPLSVVAVPSGAATPEPVRAGGPARRTMFFSGMSVGGGWSLKTFLPFLSIHCH